MFFLLGAIHYSEPTIYLVLSLYHTTNNLTYIPGCSQFYMVFNNQWVKSVPCYTPQDSWCCLFIFDVIIIDGFKKEVKRVILNQ